VSSGSSGRSTGITGPDAAAADRPAASGCWAGLLLAGCWMVAGHQPSHVSLVIWAPPALLIGRERGLALAGRARRQNSATAESKLPASRAFERPRPIRAGAVGQITTLQQLGSTRRRNFSALVWLINRVSAVANVVTCNPGCNQST
jgi:hypothetical protein